MKKLLLFDIDGTLLLSGGTGKVAFEIAFDEIFGIPDSLGDLDLSGKTDLGIFEEVAKTKLGRLLTEGETELLQERYEEIFEEQIAFATRFELMPGVVSILERLSNDNRFFLSLATGNFESAGWMKLKRGKIDHYFSTGGFGNGVKERDKIILTAIQSAEDLARAQFPLDSIYVIGDTEHDIAAAKKAGVRSIAVLTNNRTEETFKQNPPDAVLKDLTDIDAFLRILE